MNNLPWYVSSTGQGIAQRLYSLIPLVVPVLAMFNINIAPEDIQKGVDSVLIGFFIIWHAFSWIRYAMNKKHNLGKYAPSITAPSA